MIHDQQPPAYRPVTTGFGDCAAPESDYDFIDTPEGLQWLKDTADNIVGGRDFAFKLNGETYAVRFWEVYCEARNTKAGTAYAFLTAKQNLGHKLPEENCVDAAFQDFKNALKEEAENQLAEIAEAYDLYQAKEAEQAAADYF